ncbi:TRAP transporter substrate-binding protein [Oscillospiraceae bacterium PP1C4]
MFNKKSLLAIALSALMAVSATACTGAGKTASTAAPAASSAPATAASEAAAPAANATILKLAFNQSENHPQYKALKAMGDKFKEQTNGRYEIEIHPNALLGDQRATVELLQANAIQLSVVGNPLVENYNKDFAVIGLPYVYDSMEHQKKVFTGGVLDELFKSVSKEGFEVIAAFTAGSRNIYCDKPIKTPADLKGYKIRCMESDTMVKMIGYMGGVGTPMGQGDVYTAIQSGVLNGGENNEVTYADLKHYEVAPYFSYTQHLMVPDLIIASNTFLASLSAEDKATFDKLIDEMVAEEFALWGENVEIAKKAAIDGGATFVEDIDIAPFQEACKPLAEAVAGSSETAGKLYEAVRALAK